MDRLPSINTETLFAACILTDKDNKANTAKQKDIITLFMGKNVCGQTALFDHLNKKA